MIDIVAAAPLMKGEPAPPPACTTRRTSPAPGETNMNRPPRVCPNCHDTPQLDRRRFIHTTSAGAAALAVGGGLSLGSVAGVARAEDTPTAETPESLTKVLFESLTPGQKEQICFDWDYEEPERGLLRTRVANNWNITRPSINSDFYSADQQQLIRDIFEGLIVPEWHARYDKQLQDDAGGFGNHQSIGIFGTPGDGSFELVMTGRHMTLRCDGNSAEHLAFGGPIFYGHAAQGFNERPDHPGNVFWEQAVAANSVYEMLDGQQREQALEDFSPIEQESGFQGPDAELPGIRLSELSDDQLEAMQGVLAKLLEPYRQSDREEVRSCLEAQGGLENCALSFYADQDVGNDKVWDNWRLEGPSFVWYFRGAPHVHVWVNVASDPSIELNA